VGQLRGQPDPRLSTSEVDSYVDSVLSQLPEADTAAIAPEEEVRTRDLPLDLAHRDFTHRLGTYRQAKSAVSEARPPRSHVLLLAACQDEQLALDGARNGLFTQCLLSVWDQGRFSGVGYPQFHQQILRKLTAPQQTPNLYWATPVEPRFEQQRPFTI
jgi:metacaspase-1